MCGRYFRHRSRDELAAAFSARPGDDSQAPIGYNIAPSQIILAVRFNGKSGERVIDGLQWGLVPHFATDRKIAWKLTNARSETVDTLPSYRVAYAKRRCLIPADGFYEWRAIGKAKQPYAFALESQQAFAIAGLWENWRDPSTGHWVRSCTMITTAANELVAAIHDRMPVILEPGSYSRWLGEEPDSLHKLKALLRPYDPSRMVSWPVTRAINKPGGVDDGSLLDPVEVPEDAAGRPA
jgi:putative SOS response-associated peptidase YedK